jgi:hypothetical protein
LPSRRSPSLKAILCPVLAPQREGYRPDGILSNAWVVSKGILKPRILIQYRQEPYADTQKIGAGHLMHIVALYDIPDNREALAKALATALRKTLYETSTRLRAPGAGPLVVRVFSEPGPAEALVSELTSRGFSTVVLGQEEVESEAGQFVARKFLFGKDHLHVESRQGEKAAVAYREIEIMVRGTGISGSTEVETVKERKFDLGKAIMTNGLSFTKTTTRTEKRNVEMREGFLNLYTGSPEAVILREGALIYDSLGPALQLTSVANFNSLVAELRRKNPDASYDDSLLTRAGQANLLGPQLIPEKHLEVALCLLAKVLRQRRSSDI